MTTAVLIHGRHLQAHSWENIVWGKPRALGQVPSAVELALRHQASLIFWGTGASERDSKKESEYTFGFAMERIEELATMISYEEGPEHLRDYLRKFSYVDIKTQNTTQEIEVALQLCHERGIKELYLVSSPSHIARCLQEALKLLAARPEILIRVYATASQTCFANSTAADVVIVEPPHRGDLPLWQTYRYVRAMFSLMRDTTVFESFLNDFGALLRHYGVTVTWKSLP